MSFDLNDDQLAFQETARRFAREKLAPGYQRREVEGRIDRALVREMGDLGLIAPELPEEFGGLGTPSLTSGLIAEAIGYADVNAAYIQILGSLNGKIIAGHARPELARQWLPRLVSGEVIVAIGLTEPRGGSDAANLALSARRSGDTYILKGEKSSISMADQADAVVLFARTGTPESGAHGVSAFLVPMNTPGVTTLRYNDLGSKAIGRSSIFFDDVVIPSQNRLADEGAGFVQVMQGFDFSRALDWPPGAGFRAGLARRKLGLCSGAEGIRSAAVEKSRRDLSSCRSRDDGRGHASALLSHARTQGRGKAPYRRGGHVQMACAEDGGRRHPSVPADAWPLWLVARPAASATPARCHGAGDR